MVDTDGLAEIEQQAKRLLELLDKALLTNLDFDNREHIHVIGLCLDTAIEHVKKIK